MGDMADLMLDGTICEACGEIMDRAGRGYPKRCAECSGGGNNLGANQYKREKRRNGRIRRQDEAIKELCKHEYSFQTINLAPLALRIGPFDFWPGTGTWKRRDTGFKSFGVIKLIEALKKEEMISSK